jgi:hypothetical protein
VVTIPSIQTVGDLATSINKRGLPMIRRFKR